MTLADLTRANDALTATVQSLYAERARLILEARAEGFAWAEIADAMRMTVHGAIKASHMGGDA